MKKKSLTNYVFSRLLVSFCFIFFSTSFSFSQTWTLVQPTYPTNDAIVAGFVADVATYGNGTTDATAYLQNCLNKLDSATVDPEHGGGVLYLPAGKYKVTGTLLIPKGITIRGDWQKPVKGQPINGTILMAYNDQGNAAGTPFITMRSGAAVIGLAFWYPEQDPNNIVAYPPTIQFGQPNYFGNEFCNATNITLVNAYNGISFYSGGGTCPTINGVYGTPLKQGIQIDRIVDIGRIDWCDFSPAYWAGSGLAGAPALTNKTYTQWIYNNGIGIIMRRNDWSYSSYVSVEGYNMGFYATKSLQADNGTYATPNGHNYGFTFTNCQYGLYFDGNNSVGIMFTEVKTIGCQYGVYLAPNTGGVLQLYKWNIGATANAIYSDKTSTTNITLQESTISSGRVELQGSTLIATDNDFNNSAPQVEFEANSRGNLTGNRYLNPVDISQKSIFVNQIDNTPVTVTDLPAYYEFVPQSKQPSRSVMYNAVTAFGATWGIRTNIPATDATPAIQNALNKASVDGGGIVYLPPGHYRINGSLIIPTGVELKGSVDVGEEPLGPGSVLEIYGNKDNPSGASPIQIKQGGGLRGIVINYPEQLFCSVLPDSVHIYPYTIQVQGSDAYIVNVGLRAAYKGVDLFTFECDRFYVDFLTGFVFNGGLNVGNSSANGVVANMQFNTIVYNNGDETKFGVWPNSIHTSCSTDATKNPYNYSALNLDFLTVGNAPNILLYDDFNYGANHGLILQDGAQGEAIGLGLDGDRTGILVDGNANFNFINTQDVALNYDALGGDQSSYLKTTTNFTTGTINMFSSDYWGQATSSGIVMNGAGTLNLQSANFQSSGSQSFADVNNGKLIIDNSVVSPVTPLVNGTSLSGANIQGSLIDPNGLNTSGLGTWFNNLGSVATPSSTSAISRTGWIATASRTFDSTRIPQYGIDGNLTTSWTCGWQNDGVAEWYEVDMITPQTFNEVVLEYATSPSDFPDTYTLSVSTDGINWTQVAAGSGAQNMTVIPFATTTARYFRIDKPATSTKANFWAIQELYVFNVPPTPVRSAFNGPHNIPGTLEAEDFDNGGEGLAYHVSQNPSQTPVYRPTENVAIESYTAGQYDIGFTTNGEWTTYTVNVANDGYYKIESYVASGNANGQFHLEMDNVVITGNIIVPNTTTWSNFISVVSDSVPLTGGTHVFKWYTNGNMNMDKFVFSQDTFSLKPVAMSNPLFTEFQSPLYGGTGSGPMYTADASAHVWADGRLYVYASHDIDPAVGCNRMDRYHVFSTSDMKNWVDHGEILNASEVPWGLPEGGFMWAPDCAYNPANQTYYYYYPHPSTDDWGNSWKIGIATSKNPASGFTVQGYIQGLESLIDPCIFVDDDGQPYLFYGGGGTCMGGKLNKNDWTQIADSMQQMTGLVDFHEATWMHKYNGKYYLSHSDNHGSDGNQMKYAVSDNPLGPWTDMGVYLYATGCDTDHGSIVKFNGQWYAFYHTANFSGQYNLRSVCVDSLNYNPDGSIQMVKNWGTPFKGITRTVVQTNNTTDIALTLEAEDFNDGLPQYGYWNNNGVNQGGNTTYRPNVGVSIENRANNVIDVGYMQNGEWLRYTITVQTAGLYDIDCIVASGVAAGGKFHLSINGTNMTGDIVVPFTSSDWNTWTTVTAKNIVLQAGTQYIDMRINGGYNFDKFQFRKSAPYQGTPYNGPHNVPGTVEAEDYDNGGPNVAYFDTDSINQGGVYRPGVDLENSSGSIHMAWTFSGEWTKYTINVTQAGTYNIQIPVSTGNAASGSLSLTFDDITSYPLATINTGSWNTYQILTVPNVTLTAGIHVMTLNIGGNINVDKFTFVKTSNTPAAVTLNGLTATYDGTAKTVTATTTPSGLTTSITYNGSTTPPTASGTYTVVATVTSAGYQGSAIGSLVIAKSTAATISLSGLTPTYDGTAKIVTATTTPSGLTVGITYNGSTTAPTAVGTYPIVATINDANYQGSTTGSLVIAKATATVSLSGLTPTYSGTAKTVTATTTPAGLTVNITYNGSTTAPTAVGTYPIVATISDANYQGSATGSLVIAKATATVSLSGLTPTYSGTAKTVTATTTPSGLTVAITYNGSTTAPTAVGTYPIVAAISDANYQGSITGSLVISKATATVSLSGLTATYSGTAKTVSATTTPSGLTVNITYNGSTTAPTSVGTYPIVATISNANYQGSTTGSLVISKATATVSLNGLTATYDGTAKTVTATTTPTGLTVNITYNGSTTAPSAVGTYPIVATISDANYQGSATGSLVISNKPTATITLSGLTPTYDGTTKAVTATTSPSGLNVTITYNGSATVPTASGTYQVVATVNDPNYQGTTSGSLVIAKATASNITLSGLTATYDGTAKMVTATTTPSGLTVGITYNGSTTAPTAVGTYPIVATISDANYQGSATGSLVISKATATVSLSGLTPTYDSTAKTVSATTTPSGLTVNITYNGSTTAPTVVGTYPIVATISDANYQGSTTGSLVISKATATVSLSGLTPTYDGTAKTVSATTTPSGLTANITYNGSATAPTAVGTYPIVATIDDPNYQGSTTGSLVIAKATVSNITLNGLTATYDGTTKTVSATTTPAGLNVTITYNGSATVPTGTGTYQVVATINDPNYQGTTTGSLVIAKATASNITLSGLTATYDGTAKTVTATTTPSGLTVNITYNGSTTVPTAVGTYPIVATISDANYQGSATGSLIISKATATVSLSGLTATYDGTAKIVTATTTPSGLTVTITYNGSTTAPSAKGTYPVVATIDDANYQGSTTGSLVISGATGTINTETSQVDIISYNNIIKVSGVKIGDVISVYTLNGTLLFNMTATQKTEYIYSLKDGVYVVSIVAENISRKVLVH
jgi:hypothetical protein